jgi:hypothetical protein
MLKAIVIRHLCVKADKAMNTIKKTRVAENLNQSRQIIKISKMKKVLVLLMGVVLFASCEKSSTDESIQEVGSIQAVIAAQETPQARTDVKRGQIYAWVKDVTITAESQATNYTAEETYDLLDAGDAGYNNAAALFQLEDVALGPNLVSASSTSNVTPVTVYDANGDSTVLTKAAWITNYKDNVNPYAVYATDAPVAAEVLQSGTTPISLEMNTKNARLISAISMNPNFPDAQYLTDNFTATSKVEIKEVGGSWTLVDETVITDTKYSTFYWSDVNSIGGAKYRVTVTVKRNSDGVVIAQDDRVVTLANSTSYRCNFVMNVTDNELFGDVELNLIWQKWIEAPCPGC